jgi:hypothetical protein
MIITNAKNGKGWLRMIMIITNAKNGKGWYRMFKMANDGQEW